MPRINTATGSNNHQPGETPEQLQNCALCTAAALTGETSDVVNRNLQKGLANPAKCWGEFQSDKAFTEYVTYDPSVQEKGKNIFGADILVPITPVEPILQGLQQIEQEFLAYTGQDPNALAENALPYQIVGLAVYVNGKLGNKVQWSMRPTEFIPRADSDAGPRQARVAIPFMNSQPDGTKFAVYTTDRVQVGLNAHWIYAAKEGGKVTFKDFQHDMQVPLTLDVRKGSLLKFPNFPQAPGPVISENPLGPNGKVYTDRTELMFVLAFGDKLVAA
jgi:hypothetical protein